MLPRLQRPWLMCCLWLCQWQLVVAVLVVVLPLAQGWWQQALLVALPMLLPGQLAAALQQLLLLALQKGPSLAMVPPYGPSSVALLEELPSLANLVNAEVAQVVPGWVAHAAVPAQVVPVEAVQALRVQAAQEAGTVPLVLLWRKIQHTWPMC